MVSRVGVVIVVGGLRVVEWVEDKDARERSGLRQGQAGSGWERPEQGRKERVRAALQQASVKCKQPAAGVHSVHKGAQ